MSPSGGGAGVENQMTMEATKHNYYAYNKNLRTYAHKLRSSMTKAEACLWKYALKAGAMKGYTFRRQRPVLKYIADFMCKELKLIIEVDGITHQWDDVIAKDTIRQKNLEQAGFKVIRFSDDEVLKDISNVIREIELSIEQLEAQLTTPLIPRQRGKRSNLN
jgi:very-short-patch-repair endonuclease